MQASNPYSSLPADFQRMLLVSGALFAKATQVSLNCQQAFVDSVMSDTMYRMSESMRLMQSVTVANFFED